MSSLLALAGATAVLVAIPGPNVALIVANSLRFGFHSGIATVLGTTLGVGLQLVLVVAGLAAILQVAAEALSWIRWAGVAYLVWLGVSTWRQPAQDLASVAAVRTMVGRGCLVAAGNPKTLLFNAAFLPQFASTGAATELALVAAVFLTVLFVGDALWAAFANAAKPLLARHATARNRVSGAFLVAAGIGLALARRGGQAV